MYRNCLGEERSCNVTSEEQCESPKPEVATRAPANIQCVTCSGVTGSSCDVTPHREADEFCTSACLSVKYLNLPNRTVTRVLRGCQTNLNIPAALTINTCTEDTVKDEVVCSTSCYDYKCNKYSSGIPSCWSEKGEIKPECEGTTPAIPQHLINPSRVSTKKPYSIQDAYGGDNYRGEWRPPEEDQNSTSTNQTVKWKRNYENEGPYFGQTYKNQAESVIKANGIVYLFFIHLTLLYIIFLF
ncbi:hypothetical protein EB796_024302 [Bugula neritina]|uniref:Uncharacterized protein n=1 Tax=Bugula neritina TaxID=10212 RepID=A0A7J7IVY2_BUGNE|nr:hypothetical protein EB796_024302 [Bugula neritina]